MRRWELCMCGVFGEESKRRCDRDRVVDAGEVIGDERRERRSNRRRNGKDVTMKGKCDVWMGQGERLSSDGCKRDRRVATRILRKRDPDNERKRRRGEGDH